MNDFYRIFIDYRNPSFWNAWGVVIPLSVALGGLLNFIFTKIFNNTVSKTTKIIINALIEQYLVWVRVKSQSQQVCFQTIIEWLVEDAGGLKMGRSYLVFKKFIVQLKGRGYNISKIDEKVFEEKIREYDSSTKLSREEW